MQIVTDRMAGPFETHLTLNSASAHVDGVVARLASKESLKLTVIELSVGQQRLQPMLTCHSNLCLAEELACIESLNSELAAQGISVVRVKIEVDANHPAAPDSPLSATQASGGTYFENHVKIRHSNAQDVEALDRIGKLADAHASRNARRTLPDGSFERFFTQRFFGATRSAAKEGLEQLRSRLLAESITIIEEESEFVIYDSCLDLDVGWLDRPLLIS